MTFSSTVRAACQSKRAELGRQMTPAEADAVLDGCFKEASDGILGEARLAWEKARKEKKKGAIDDRAHGLYKLYPRSEGGTDALQKITKAINEHGYERVYEGTKEYAAAVARWSHARRHTQSGASTIPMPSTWFGNARYNDDSKAWWEGTGGRDAVLKPKPQLTEPSNWRQTFPDFLHVNEAWANIDPASQSYICEQMKLRKQA